MVLVDIKNDEIAALDLVLNEAKVKPIIGYKVINLRYKIEKALQLQRAEAQAKEKAKKNGNKKSGKT